MDQRAKNRLQKALDDTTANWVEVSADDVIEACAAEGLDPDKDTVNLASAANKVIVGRPVPRRGPPAYCGMNVQRAGLEHLLGRLDEPKRQLSPPGTLDVSNIPGEGQSPEAQAVPDAPEGEEDAERA